MSEARVRGREELPKSEVRGSGWEELPCIQDQWGPGGDTPRPRSVSAERRHPTSEVRGGGRKELPCV